MEEQELEICRQELLQMQANILDESELTLNELQSESTLFPDPNDRATLESEHITNLRIRDRERKLLIKVREALDRIEDGTFGECEECGDPIGFERLKVRPVTTYCINCKEEQEEQERKHKS